MAPTARPSVGEFQMRKIIQRRSPAFQIGDAKYSKSGHLRQFNLQPTQVVGLYVSGKAVEAEKLA